MKQILAFHVPGEYVYLADEVDVRMRAEETAKIEAQTRLQIEGAVKDARIKELIEFLEKSHGHLPRALDIEARGLILKNT